MQNIQSDIIKKVPFFVKNQRGLFVVLVLTISAFSTSSALIFSANGLLLGVSVSLGLGFIMMGVMIAIYYALTKNHPENFNGPDDFRMPNAEIEITRAEIQRLHHSVNDTTPDKSPLLILRFVKTRITSHVITRNLKTSSFFKHGEKTDSRNIHLGENYNYKGFFDDYADKPDCQKIRKLKFLLIESLELNNSYSHKLSIKEKDINIRTVMFSIRKICSMDGFKRLNEIILTVGGEDFYYKITEGLLKNKNIKNDEREIEIKKGDKASDTKKWHLEKKVFFNGRNFDGYLVESGTSDSYSSYYNVSSNSESLKTKEARCFSSSEVASSIANSLEYYQLN